MRWGAFSDFTLQGNSPRTQTVHERIRYKRGKRFAWNVIEENTTRWNTALVILSFLTTFKRSKKNFVASTPLVIQSRTSEKRSSFRSSINESHWGVWRWSSPARSWFGSRKTRRDISAYDFPCNTRAMSSTGIWALFAIPWAPTITDPLMSINCNSFVVTVSGLKLGHFPQSWKKGFAN